MPPMPDADEVDIPRLLFVGSGLYSVLTATLHPLNVLKTRAQAFSSQQQHAASRLQQLQRLVGDGGVRGLFAGLGPVLAGAIPARAAYILALEGVRPSAERTARAVLPAQDASVHAAIGNGTAGLAAASASMIVYVPMDVVSQKMMMPTTAAASGGAPSSSAASSGVGVASVVRDIVSTSGWRGLYRGIGISFAIGLPAGSIWWATYGATRAWLKGADGGGGGGGDSGGGGGVRLSELQQTAASSTAAAVATVLSVAPIDTVKTQHQLATASGETAWQLTRRLVRTDGVLSLYAGTTPRLLHLALWSTCLITIYEELKRRCVRRVVPPSTVRLVRTLTDPVQR